MATIAIAVQARAISALHASQADYVRSAAELRLDGAQQLMASALSQGGVSSAQDTKLSLGGIEVDAAVQPENAKLDLIAATKLDDTALISLGASHPAQVRIGLSQLAERGDADPAHLRALDPAPRWGTCAPAAISGYGANSGAPMVLSGPAAAHAGEVWRIVAWDAWGWTDDRLVRVTGDKASASRTIFRTFHRNLEGRAPCPIPSAAAPA